MDVPKLTLGRLRWGSYGVEAVHHAPRQPQISPSFTQDHEGHQPQVAASFAQDCQEL
jgi:hypothetical protein